MSLYDYKGNSLLSNVYGNIANLANYGSLDTAQGFESAWNRAMNDNSIAGISIPIGDYNINHTLLISRSNIAIDGNCATIHLRADNLNAIRMNYVDNIIIDRLNIVMHQSIRTEHGTAFYIQDCNYVTIQNLYVFGISSRGAMVLNEDMTSATNGCSKIVFDNLHLVGIGVPNEYEPEWPYGILLVNARDSVVKNCTVSGMSRVCIAFKNYVRNCFMLNNHCEDGRHALSLASDVHTDITSSNNVVIMGNTVKNSLHPLWIGRTENVNVVGNVLQGGQMFIENVFNGIFNSNIMDVSADTQTSLLRIDNSDNLIFNENLYKKGEDTNLYELINNPTNIYITGFMNGNTINIVNPTTNQ